MSVGVNINIGLDTLDGLSGASTSGGTSITYGFWYQYPQNYIFW